MVDGTKLTKLKRLRLKNYCGYRTFDLDLTDGDSIKKWTMLYGPNGVGKSNFLEAVRLLTYPTTVRGRPDLGLFFRKLTYHPDYQPGCEGFDKSKTEMSMYGLFDTPDGDKEVELKNDWTLKGSGLTKDEIGRTEAMSMYVDADNPMNMQKFQLNSKYREQFLDFAKTVYGFECEIPDSKTTMVKELDPITGEWITFYLDFIITKFGNTKVHFKRMSDGEKKIATMLRTLFNRAYDNQDAGILLIDNIEMHIYFKRHMNLLKKLEEHFPDRQIIATTHSPVIINEMDDKYLYDLEEYIGRGEIDYPSQEDRQKMSDDIVNHAREKLLKENKNEG
jgi:predicted ATPase